MNFLDAGSVEGANLKPTVRRNNSMKFTISKIVTAVITVFGVMPSLNAANVTLDGYGFYSLGTKVTYIGNPPDQSGRYKSLGSDYYHNISYRMDFITNRSNSGSGSLSWEFWAMPYYDAQSGIVLTSRGINPMPKNYSIKNANRSGPGIFLDARRFPEMDLWEYTSSGWKSRSYLTFPKKIWL